jgi:hypothetical protein
MASHLSVLLQVICDAHELSELVFGNLPPEKWSIAVGVLQESSRTKPGSADNLARKFARDRDVATMLRDFDSSLLFVAAQDLLFAIDAVREHVADHEQGWQLELATPLGSISIGREHEHDSAMPPMLLIDWGGNDTYPAIATNALPVQRVSIALDFGGDDQYLDKKPTSRGYAAGQCGIGMLFDFSGDDHYEVSANGLAYAAFGVGLLYDGAGDDNYVAEEKGHGVAYAGAALLVDVSGNDRYSIHTRGQGFGGPGGVGVLADLSGNDEYVADDEELLFASAQTAQHNESLAQGCGNGWRADHKHGLSVPGGIGVLFDARGNDTYSCGVFGQGVGYWSGMGLLIDRKGADRYRGQWYVQGASAHFAVGILVDDEGDDSYHATMNMSQAAGHDLGVGILLESAGNDQYTTGTLSLGASHASGIGWFTDFQGDDTYDIVRGDDNLGHAATSQRGGIRASIPGIGLFFDLEGKDSYPDGRGQDKTQWHSGHMAYGVDLGTP